MVTEKKSPILVISIVVLILIIIISAIFFVGLRGTYIKADVTVVRSFYGVYGDVYISKEQTIISQGDYPIGPLFTLPFTGKDLTLVMKVNNVECDREDFTIDIPAGTASKTIRLTCKVEQSGSYPIIFALYDTNGQEDVLYKEYVVI